VVTEFDGWTAKELPGLNAALATKGQPKIELLQRAAWEKQGEEEGAGTSGGPLENADGAFERD
jgi:hypothetical protein